MNFHTITLRVSGVRFFTMNLAFLPVIRRQKPRGLFVSFGNSSGPVDAFNIGLLSQKGSLYATRPTLFAYIATRAALDACANSLFDVVQSNKVRINIHQTYPLAEAGRAHTDLEARKTSGTTLLIP